MKIKQITFMALLFQWLWYTFDTSFAVELATTAILLANTQAVRVARTILREKREFRCVWTLVRIALLLAKLWARCGGELARRLNIFRRLRFNDIGFNICII